MPDKRIAVEISNVIVGNATELRMFHGRMMAAVVHIYLRLPEGTANAAKASRAMANASSIDLARVIIGELTGEVVNRG